MRCDERWRRPGRGWDVHFVLRCFFEGKRETTTMSVRPSTASRSFLLEDDFVLKGVLKSGERAGRLLECFVKLPEGVCEWCAVVSLVGRGAEEAKERANV